MKSERKLQEKVQQSFGQLESFRFYSSWDSMCRRLSLSCTDLRGLEESVKMRSKKNQSKLLLETFLGQTLWHLLKGSSRVAICCSVYWCCILSQLLQKLILCGKLGIHSVRGKLVLFYLTMQTRTVSFHKA